MGLNRTLTTLFADKIIKEDLIDTGALLRSIKVFTDYNRDVLEVNIVSKFYLKYLKDKYHLVEQFKNDPIFANEVALLLLPLFEIQIFTIVNNTPGTKRFDPSVVILINGR
jgi:hypothetical protein